MNTLPVEVRTLVAQFNALKKSKDFYDRWLDALDEKCARPRMNMLKLRYVHGTGYSEYKHIMLNIARIIVRMRAAHKKLNALLGLQG